MSKSKRTLISLATMGLLTLAANARAEPAKGDAFTTDFEGASLAQWSVKVANERFASAVKIEPIDGRKAYQLTGPAIAELEDKPNEARVQLETIDGDAALHVQGPIASIKENILGRVTAFREATVTRYEVLAALPKLRTDTFDLEVDIKGVGGVQFGGGFKVYIGKVGDIGTLMYQTPMQGVKRIGLRYLSLNKWNRLKVVCTPSFVRIYRAGSLVGNVVINRKQGWPKGVSKAPIALFGQDAYFDDLRVSAAPSPLDASIVVPALPQNVRPEAYAFPATADVTVQFDVLNYGSSEVQFSLAIDEFDKASRQDMGQQPVPARSANAKRLAFELGRMKPGLYQMHLAFSAGGETAGKLTWPLAVLRSMGGKKEDFVRPALPMAPYLKAMKYTRTRPPFYGNTYIYKVLDDLRYYGFTALVDGFMRNEHLDLCQRYGIAVWDRGRPRNHPVVLGALIGDEPTHDSMPGYVRDYEAARAGREDHSQLLLTNVIADASSSCVSNFFWDVIKPRHRFCRIYSGSGASSTLDNLRLVGKTISYPGQLLTTRNYGDTPYSIILPTFGGGTTAYYRDPTPAETKVMMHLSMAYGSKGLAFYSWQGHAGGKALVSGASLRPLDGKLVAAAEVLRKVRRHDRLIRSLEPEQRRVYCTSPWVEAVPLGDGKGAYIYAVNRNIRSKTSVELSWDPERRVARVTDLFAGQPLQVYQAPFEDDETSARARLNFLPGEGKLLAVEAR